MMKKWVIISGVRMMLYSGICLEVWADTLEIEKEMPVEELFFMEIPIVVTAARKEQSQFETAAATYVITSEDIRRSGTTTIPELLRMVPGLDVAHISANKWAISSRGFNGSFATKLLVMIDGRSVYTPLFAGVYWDVQDTLLEDIERIEVVRGPGGTLWGANAVNGVINIITKSAKDTQGGLLHAGYGDREEGFGAVRYGLKPHKDVYLRAYAKYFNRDDFVGGHDQWQAQRGGFRLDWDISYQDSLTALGDYYDGRSDQRFRVTSLSPPSFPLLADTEDVNGGNVLLRWQRRPSEESDIILQAYFDNAERVSRVLDQRIDTYDLDFQHRFPLGDRQEITWGLGYRLVSDELKGSFTVSFDPDERNAQLFSTFLQDQITIRDDLWLTLGSKFEHNDYTGFEIQPSGRFLWQPLQRHALWGAVSRAVRTPARSEHDIRFNSQALPPQPPPSPPLPILSAVLGNEGFESEDLLAYELGYRHQLTQRLSIDVAGFYNTYDNLLTVQRGGGVVEAEPPPMHVFIPVEFDNLMHGETYGVELAADWQAIRYWRLSSSYTWLKMNLHLESESNDRLPEDRDDDVEGDSPEHQFQIRSYLNLPYNLEQDTALYYVSRLHSEEDVFSYTRLDVRLGWRPRDDLELSLSAQNLLEEQHRENTGGAGGFFGSSEVPRSIYAKVTWKF